jgi:circadian clock protein KaiC
MHLATLHKLVNEFEPRMVIVDPITTFLGTSTSAETEAMLMRLIDFLKARHITAVLTSLVHSGSAREGSQAGISSLIDTWLLLRDIELGGERNRGLHILKSRGMAHSNQVREFLLTDHGVELKDVYIGPEGVLTGSMRLAQEAREQAASLDRQQEFERRQRELERKRLALEAQMATLRGQFEAEEDELKLLVAREESTANAERESKASMARSRKADQPAEGSGTRPRATSPQRPRK